QHLHLHVARIGQVALDVHRGVGEELLALSRGAVERLFQLALGLGHAEALASAAARGLDRHRVAHRRVDHLGGVGHGLHGAGACGASRSGSEYTATLPMPSSSNVRITRMAISPRLATRTLPNMGAEGYATCPGKAQSAGAGAD